MKFLLCQTLSKSISSISIYTLLCMDHMHYVLCIYTYVLYVISLCSLFILCLIVITAVVSEYHSLNTVTCQELF